MMVSVICDECGTMESKCKNRDVGYDEWHNVIMDSISVSKERVEEVRA